MFTWSIATCRSMGISSKYPCVPKPALLTRTSISRPFPRVKSRTRSGARGRSGPGRRLLVMPYCCRRAGGEFFEPVDAAGDEDEVRFVAGEEFGQFPANARGGSGDEGSFDGHVTLGSALSSGKSRKDREVLEGVRFHNEPHRVQGIPGGSAEGQRPFAAGGPLSRREML